MRVRVVIALAMGLTSYALSDILLWQRIFEAHGLYEFDAPYQVGHTAVLIGLIAVGIVLLWERRAWAAWYGLALFTLAYSGVEDMLYYLLDGRTIPATLPWLERDPLILFKPVTEVNLLLSSGLWVAFWAASLFALPGLARWMAVRSRGGAAP